MLRTKRLAIATVVGSVAIASLLGGCASGSPSPPSETNGTSSENLGEQAGSQSAPDAATGASGVATVSVDGRMFEFELSMCSVYEGGEALISGLGSEVGSEVPSYLDGDSVSFEHGEFRVDIGADGPFQSSDDFLAIGSSLGGNFSVAEDGRGYIVTGQAWSGSNIDLGIGTVQFSCN